MLRKQKGYSQEAFAARVGVHRTYMGLIERGMRNPTFLRMADMAEVLGIDLSTLLKI